MSFLHIRREIAYGIGAGRIGQISRVPPGDVDKQGFARSEAVVAASELLVAIWTSAALLALGALFLL